uniref:Deoxynucleotide monophosphate kinase n=1 Tax=Pithovirus LCDPAC02 TaxID=2506601 RepID=A0A481YR08_9VIRU|nr:MAG: deoxynucleotide monophosphate kinase [Pithovirus LCDPAC02]
MKIILIKGKINSGKDYLTNFIIDKFYRYSHFVHLKFAGVLKWYCTINKIITKNTNSKTSYNNFFGIKNKEDRLNLINIAKKVKYIDNDSFVNFIIQQIENYNIDNTIFIFSDLRFPNEFESLYEKYPNFKFIIFNKLNENKNTNEDFENEISETVLYNYKFPIEVIDIGYINDKNETEIENLLYNYIFLDLI